MGRGSFIRKMKGAVIPGGSGPAFVNLEGWCKGVREIWEKRDGHGKYDLPPRPGSGDEGWI